ncbi:hypothetical protein [Mesomycoplasma ovipneumoniae]|uniref:hypothetical protein n=1 Tax=Mesomycoplasma ovipneumoniae TaxID=29562 RepID=UPI0029648A20|nr:hypothetical protein [Mesomycoplasma ovipneumoniae]MDW2931058.1 hypothetical protein [Mesomycoplasma ovipneumoniae]
MARKTENIADKLTEEQQNVVNLALKGEKCPSRCLYWKWKNNSDSGSLWQIT